LVAHEQQPLTRRGEFANRNCCEGANRRASPSSGVVTWQVSRRVRSTARRHVARAPLEVMKTGEDGMMKCKLGALVAAGLLAGGMSATSSTSAFAADLGGTCCADLEERIAELEATTARKGNRKVSLTVSGWVGEQVMWWDDGGESNVYVTGLGSTLASPLQLTGQATISPGWYAGYVIHTEVNDSDSLTINQVSQHN